MFFPSQVGYRRSLVGVRERERHDRGGERKVRRRGRERGATEGERERSATKGQRESRRQGKI